MSKNQPTAAKLSDSQLVILATAAQRTNGSLLPFPQSLTVKDAALGRVVATLCKRKLAEERRTINGAPEWRRDEERRPLACSSPPTAFSPLESLTWKRPDPRRQWQACLASARRQPHDQPAKLGRFLPTSARGAQRIRKASRIW